MTDIHKKATFLVLSVLFLQLSCMKAFANATVVHESSAFQALREKRFFVVKLTQPHLVLSTSKINGGMSTDVQYLVNHQSMEPNFHQEKVDLILNSALGSYHTQIAKRLDMPPEQMALMGTAAHITNLAHKQRRFKDLTVDAFVTAGVSGNAMRAGEETQWYQTEQGNRKVDYQGTINIIVLINQPLSPGALSKASMLLTEGKSSALSQLAVPSRYGKHLATGTGTDQFIIAAPQAGQDSFVYHSESGHLKLGELIGSAVREATLEAILWQNRLAPEDTATLTHALGRFGFTEDVLLAHLKKRMDKNSYTLAKHNVKAIVGNTRVVAAAYAYATLLDRLQYQTLPEGMRAEVMRDSAATAAVALSGDTLHWSHAWQNIAAPVEDSLGYFFDALAMGWQAKWQD